MPEKENAPDNSQETEENILTKRLETLGWALFNHDWWSLSDTFSSCSPGYLAHRCRFNYAGT